MVNEFSCVCLHSDRSVQERRENLKKFKVNYLKLTFHTGSGRLYVCWVTVDRKSSFN